MIFWLDLVGDGLTRFDWVGRRGEKSKLEIPNAKQIARSKIQGPAARVGLEWLCHGRRRSQV